VHVPDMQLVVTMDASAARQQQCLLICINIRPRKGTSVAPTCPSVI
jgi:hypothetical protein